MKPRNESSTKLRSETTQLIVKIIRDEIEDAHGDLKPTVKADMEGTVTRIGERIIVALGQNHNGS